MQDIIKISKVYLKCIFSLVFLLLKKKIKISTTTKSNLLTKVPEIAKIHQFLDPESAPAEICINFWTQKWPIWCSFWLQKMPKWSRDPLRIGDQRHFITNLEGTTHV